MRKIQVIRIAAFILVSILMLSFISEFLSVPRGKDVVGVYGFYKEPENSIDVALIGPSETYTSFYSPLAYEKFGFTSYALAVSGMRGSCYPSAIREMEAVQKPQVYVLELFGFCYKDQTTESFVRGWVDSLPDSENRDQTIREVVAPEDQENYLEKFKKYHSNWVNLGSCLKAFLDKRTIDSQGYSITKNFATETRSGLSDKPSGKYGVSEEGMKRLKETIALLKERGIQQVLFVRTPEKVSYQEQESLQEALSLIRDAGYDYLDMHSIQDKIGIDGEKDYYNPYHCNIYGAEKVTDYLGQYLAEHYNIRTEHSQEVTEEWENCASYNDHVIDRLKDAVSNNKRGYYYTQKDLLGL